MSLVINVIRFSLWLLVKSFVLSIQPLLAVLIKFVFDRKAGLKFVHYFFGNRHFELVLSQFYLSHNLFIIRRCIVTCIYLNKKDENYSKTIVLVSLLHLIFRFHSKCLNIKFDYLWYSFEKSWKPIFQNWKSFVHFFQNWKKKFQLISDYTS